MSEEEKQKVKEQGKQYRKILSVEEKKKLKEYMKKYLKESRKKISTMC